MTFPKKDKNNLQLKKLQNLMISHLKLNLTKWTVNLFKFKSTNLLQRKYKLVNDKIITIEDLKKHWVKIKMIKDLQLKMNSFTVKVTKKPLKIWLDHKRIFFKANLWELILIKQNQKEILEWFLINLRRKRINLTWLSYLTILRLRKASTRQ